MSVEMEDAGASLGPVGWGSPGSGAFIKFDVEEGWAIPGNLSVGSSKNELVKDTPETQTNF